MRRSNLRTFDSFSKRLIIILQHDFASDLNWNIRFENKSSYLELLSITVSATLYRLSMFTLVKSKSLPFHRGLKTPVTGLLDYSLVQVVYCVIHQYTFWLFLLGKKNSCEKCLDSLISLSEDGSMRTSRVLHTPQHKNYCFYTLFHMLKPDHFNLGLSVSLKGVFNNNLMIPNCILVLYFLFEEYFQRISVNLLSIFH